ncbi:MAG: T9SS type A sorting domain-containing protein [Flavobacteriales bacterium]
MKKTIPLLVLCFACCITHAQVVTWSETVAQIVYDNCSSCHRAGQLGPFELMSYEDAVEEADDILNAVQSRDMPPWPADPDYRHFAQEAALSDEEIEAIVDWIEGGTPSGNLDTAPAAPVFPANGTQLEVIDFTVTIEPYTLQYNTDEYRWFAIENPYDQPIYINAIEIIPGLPEFVHHADLAYDLSGSTLANDISDPLPGFNGKTGGPNYDYYINAWMAGGNVVRYPDNWGIEVPAEAYFVVEVHYGPGGQGQTDSTKMHLQFITNPDDVRPVFASWFLNENSGLFIPANEISTFEHESQVFQNERSLISICPHMHFLGQSYKIWLETMEGDSIPIVDIPQWDFHWQKYYTFINPQYIPSGSRLKAIATYDNTANNEDNPNDPPQHVYGGSTTESEMLMTYVLWSYFEEGDETIWMDSTFITDIAETIQLPDIPQVFPNPAHDHLYVKANEGSENCTIKIFDVTGQLVIEENNSSSVHRFDISMLPIGTYIVQVRSNKNVLQLKLIKC